MLRDDFIRFGSVWARLGACSRFMSEPHSLRVLAGSRFFLWLVSLSAQTKLYLPVRVQV